MPTWTSTTVWTATWTVSTTVWNLATAAAQEVLMKRRKVRLQFFFLYVTRQSEFFENQHNFTLPSLHQVTPCHFMPTGALKWWTTTSQSLSPSLRQEGVGLPLWTTCQRQTVRLFSSTGKQSITSTSFTGGSFIYLFYLFIFRCNIAVILLTDLIVDHGVKVEWSAYIHLLLHAIFIGNFSPILNMLDTCICISII